MYFVCEYFWLFECCEMVVMVYFVLINEFVVGLFCLGMWCFIDFIGKDCYIDWNGDFYCVEGEISIFLIEFG